MRATLAITGVNRVIMIMIRPAALMAATAVNVANMCPVILIIVMVGLQPPCLHQNSCYSCLQAPPSTPNRHPRTQQLPPQV